MTPEVCKERLSAWIERARCILKSAQDIGELTPTLGFLLNMAAKKQVEWKEELRRSEAANA